MHPLLASECCAHVLLHAVCRRRYWNIPITKYIVPRQVQFNADIKVINECLDDLIRLAQSTRQEEEYEAMQQRDYANVKVLLSSSQVHLNAYHAWQ